MLDFYVKNVYTYDNNSVDLYLDIRNTHCTFYI